jgi:hypothetical protein
MTIRTSTQRTFVFSSLLLTFAPLLRAEAQDVDVPGNLTMHDSADPTVGSVLKEGVPFLHNFGTNNTFLGSGAGNFTMSGVANTAVGVGALYSNTTGSSNTATGAAALFLNTSGSGNTATGLEALHSNTIGSSNTAIGVQALTSNTTGNANTAIGTVALNNNTTGSGNTATGNAALYGNTTGSGNTAKGRAALYNNTTGSSNTATGDSALSSNSTGNGNTALGFNADVSAGDLINATAIGAYAVADASNKIRLGNTAVTVIEGQVPYTYTSDRNQKENFRSVDAETVLSKLRGLAVTSWNYKRQDATHFRHYGPVAQDFFAAFGHDDVGTIGTPTTITSGDLDGILMIAAQALEKRTVEQEKEIANLKARLAALERRSCEVTLP